MKEIEVQVVNRLGLHARAAARFVHVANRFKSKISVRREDTRVDGKSILGLLTLAAAKGSRLRLQADGEDEEQAIGELRALARANFGDDS